jgi:hypothetical protein
MYFVSIYENRRMKPVEIVLRRGGRGRTMEGVNLRHIVSTINITMYPHDIIVKKEYIKHTQRFQISVFSSIYHVLKVIPTTSVLTNLYLISDNPSVITSQDSLSTALR